MIQQHTHIVQNLNKKISINFLLFFFNLFAKKKKTTTGIKTYFGSRLQWYSKKKEAKPIASIMFHYYVLELLFIDVLFSFLLHIILIFFYFFIISYQVFFHIDILMRRHWVAMHLLQQRRICSRLINQFTFFFFVILFFYRPFCIR